MCIRDSGKIVEAYEAFDAEGVQSGKEGRHDLSLIHICIRDAIDDILD